MDGIVRRSTLNLVLLRANVIIGTRSQKSDNENSSYFGCCKAFEIAPSSGDHRTLFYNLIRD